MKVTRLRIMSPSGTPYQQVKKMAGEAGFEPALTGPGPAVLPLDYSPATDIRCHVHDVTESKSGPLPIFLNGIIPLNLPQKAARIGQQIQSLLSNPQHPIIPPSDPQVQESLYLAPLSNEILTEMQPKYRLGHAWPRGTLVAFVFASSARVGLNGITDNGNETIPLAAPPTPWETIPRSADETDMMVAPSTLPESVTEVAPC